MRKRLCYLILTVQAAIALTGCGGKEEDLENKDAPPVVLQVYAGQSEKENLELLVDAYQKKNKELSVEIHLIPNSEYTQQMMRIKNREVQADCIFFQSAGEAAIWRNKKVLKDLRPWYEGTEEAAYYCRWYEDMADDGAYYMIPYRLGKICVYYNKTLFEKNGVDVPADGWTWEDYKEAAKRLTGWEDNRKIYGSLGFEGPGLWWMFPARTRGAEDPFDPEDLEVFRESAEWCHEFTKEFTTTFPYIDWKDDGSGYNELFLEGRLGMYFGEDNEVNILNREIHNQSLEIEYDVVSLPVWDEAGTSEVYNTSVVTMSASSQYPEETYQFMEFCIGEEGAQILTENGAVPSWQSPAIQENYLASAGTPEHSECFLTNDMPTERKAGGLYNGGIAIMQNEVALYMKDEQELDYTFENIQKQLRELRAR